VADWHWEPVTDDLLDALPPAVLAAVRQVAEELAIRESMIFLDGREFTGEPPGLRTIQRGPLMLVYLTDVRSERVVIVQVNWIGRSTPDHGDHRMPVTERYCHPGRSARARTRWRKAARGEPNVANRRATGS
jgi:hypothetical protein